MWRFWKWPRPPMDPWVAMALLVRGTDKERPDWKEIVIRRQPNRPGGGVDFKVN